MTGHPISFAACQPVRERCRYLGLTPQQTRLAIKTAAKASESGACSAWACVEAQRVIRNMVRADAPPLGAA